MTEYIPLRLDHSEDLSEVEDDEENAPEEDEPVLYRTRWLMLSMLTLLTICSLMQFIFYTAVARTVQRYFGVRFYAIEYITISSMAVTLLSLPVGVWLVQKTSLRTACLVSVSLHTIAALIKFFASYASNSTGYAVTMIGQTVTSIATSFVLPMPAELAAIWFGHNERSTATSIMASGHFVGHSFGFILSTAFVAGRTDISTLEWGIKSAQIICATLSFLLLIAVYKLFEKEPPTPPSKSQAMLGLHHLKPSYKESLSIFMNNVPYCLFVVGFGIVHASPLSYWLITQEGLPEFFHGEEYQIGMMGAVSSFVGLPAMVLSGIWLDKTKTYRFSIVSTMFLIFGICLAYILQLQFSPSVTVLYVVFTSFSFFASAFTSMGLVLASEITYPVPETVSSGMLFISGHAFTIILMITASLIYSQEHNAVFSAVAMTIALFFALVLIAFGKYEFKRYAQDESKSES